MDSNEQSDGSDCDEVIFNDLFAITYSGSTSELTDKVSDIPHVTSVFLGKDVREIIKSSEVALSVRYREAETDRVEIAEQIEEFEGVEGEVLIT